MKFSPRFALPLLTCLALAMPAAADAGLMVYWDNDDAVDGKNNNPTGESTLEANIHNPVVSSANDSSFGLGAQPTPDGDTGFNTGNAITVDGVTMDGTIVVFTPNGATNDTIDEAISGNQYVEFSLTVGGLQPLQTLNLSEIGYGVDGNVTSGRHGPRLSQAALRVGDNAFTSSDLIGSELALPSPGASVNTSIDSGLLTGLTNGDEVFLRIFMADNDNTGGGGAASSFHASTRLGSVYVLGDVATLVPEPSSVLLCAIGALLMVGVGLARRRKSK